jgi:hypothetical protein
VNTDNKLKEAIDILREFVSINDEECYYDHHGYCQAHYLHEHHECPIYRARQLITEWDTEE